MKRNSALKSIRQNIAEHGHHIYVVAGGPEPRFAYTIGISQSLGAELILAGGSFYSKDEVVQIINNIAAKVGPPCSAWQELRFDIDSLGSFSLRQADTTWATMLMLGALDFYGVGELLAFQIVPDEIHWTVDVPNLGGPWSATAEPAWRWLREPWNYSVSERSVAVTNLKALRGERITEAARWEEDQWELFAGSGPDTPSDEIRPLPLGTLLAVDQSLDAVVSLPVGCGLWRDADSEWNSWNLSG